MSTALTRTILIAGVSSGLGAAFARGALGAEHTLVGTVRRADAVAAFDASPPGGAYGLVLDVTDFDAVRSTAR